MGIEENWMQSAELIVVLLLPQTNPLIPCHHHETAQMSMSFGSCCDILVERSSSAHHACIGKVHDWNSWLLVSY